MCIYVFTLRNASSSALNCKLLTDQNVHTFVRNQGEVRSLKLKTGMLCKKDSHVYRRYLEEEERGGARAG